MIEASTKKIQEQSTLSPQVLVITPIQKNQRLTIKLLQQIRKAMGKKPLSQLMESMRQKTFLISCLKKKNSKQPDSQLQTIIFKSKGEIDLLKTGEYKISIYQNNKQKHLIFSDCMIQILRKQSKQKIYKGYRYEFGKSLYIGQFIVTDKSILYSTQNGKSEQFYQQLIELNSKQKYIKYTGDWRDGSIVLGTKETYKFNVNDYEALNLHHIFQQYVEQKYDGGFKNMKFHGQGILRKYFYNNEKKTVQLKEEKRVNSKNGQIVTIQNFDPKSL